LYPSRPSASPICSSSMIVGGGAVPATSFTRHEVQRPRPPQVAVMSTPPPCAALRMVVPGLTARTGRPGRMVSGIAIRAQDTTPWRPWTHGNTRAFSETRRDSPLTHPRRRAPAPDAGPSVVATDAPRLYQPAIGLPAKAGREPVASDALVWFVELV